MMNRTAPALLSTLGLALGLAIASSSALADTLDRSLIPIGSLEQVAAFEGPGPSGIAVSPDGRTFVGFPRHAIDHPGMALAELVDGKLVPYPSRDISQPSALTDAQRLISVHGMTLDSQGRLWLIDDGKHAGQDAQLASQIKDEGEKVMTDGMDMDRQGRIYLTDAEHHQILRLWPDGRLEVVLRDPRLVWPDGIFVTAHYVYVTLGQWDRLGKNFDTRRPPYLLVHSPIDAVPQLNAQPG